MLSFVNCTKQPPSLLFVLMTLGPAIAALAVIDRVGVRGPVGRALVTLGRVPLFYYLLQWYVIHGLAVLAGLVRGLPVAWMFSPAALGPPPEGWALGLPGVYAAWAVVLAVLYVPCRWFAGVRRAIPVAGCLTFDPAVVTSRPEPTQPSDVEGKSKTGTEGISRATRSPIGLLFPSLFSVPPLSFALFFILAPSQT